jgi:phenylalanyl-tRNA synthetase beta chain
MKLSISWIFDHIVGSWKEYDIADLVKSFNATTAEIEAIEKHDIDLHNFILARIIELRGSKVVAFSAELQREIQLPIRDGAIAGNLFLLKKESHEFRWAMLSDWGSSKEGLLPAFNCKEDDSAGGWKDSFESEDYILELDNKTITNRPDLWGHRGMAREVAAILDLPFRSEETFIARLPIKQYEYFASGTPEDPFTIEIKNPEQCKRFAGLYLPRVAYRESLIWMAHRLACVDTRPLDAIVDATNYVMLDWSQPIHAFDAKKITTKMIMPRLAKPQEKLVLLDGDTVELTDHDLVITDGKKPIALAGIMGGRDSSVSMQTESLFVESANFDATTIRKTALRCKKRTESSARFEKSLDPMQNTTALLRFLKLVQEAEIPLEIAEHIISLGHDIEPKHISVAHSFIEARIGVKIDSDFIIRTLEHLEFSVEKKIKDDEIWYEIVVPTFRSSKDVTIPEDIVEEVGRFFGYDNVPLVLPSIEMKSSDMSWVYKRRMIKQLCAYSMHAREVNNYAFYDEAFLRQLHWNPEDAVAVVNPVSELWRQLVTSLMPHLLKNIQQNSTEHNRLRFFEWNRCWKKDGNGVLERKVLAGIFFDQKKGVDFYQEKEFLLRLFNALHLSVTWNKPNKVPFAWYNPFETACLTCQDTLVGFAGKINRAWLKKIVGDGDAFIFELEADALLALAPEVLVYEPLPKYPGTSFDVSMLVPLEVTVAKIYDCIKHADARIYNVSLVDFFQKEEWVDQRSVTMRFYARDPEKTLTKDAIDQIYKHVVIGLENVDARIR